MEKSPTLTDAVGNALLPFEVEGRQYYIRQPSPEEYDDAMNVQSLYYRKTIALPQVQEVADVPCSEGERRLYQVMVDDTKRRFDETPDGATRQTLADELARLQNELEGRTLAQETASDTAALKRDRWLCQRLLCDKDGLAIFSPLAKDFEKKWAKLPMKVKNEARPMIWQALTLVREAPFSSEE